MATSKTLTPTNVTIQIPEFTDQPDQRVNSNCIDKEADAINALNTQLASVKGVWVNGTMPSTLSTEAKIGDFPSGYTYSNCHVECAYVTYSNAKYVIPDNQASMWLKSDGIYGYTTSGGYRSASVSVLLRKNSIT